MIEFMNAMSPSFVAFAFVVLGSPVAFYLIRSGFHAASEERKLRYADQEESRKLSHVERMSTVKQIEGRAVEQR